MTIQDIRHARFNSSLARQILGQLYRPGQPYRVWFGPLRRFRLCYERSMTFHAVLGLLDAETFQILERVFVKSGLLPENCTVADVGCNIGYYTLWLSKIAAPAGHVYAFDPNPEVLAIVRRNLTLNETTNVEVIGSACGDHIGTTDFYLANDHHCSSLDAERAGGELAESKKITAQMITLDSFSPVSAARIS